MYKLINKKNKVILVADTVFHLDDNGSYEVEGFSSELNNNYYGVRINGKCGVVSQYGQVIVPCKYDYVKKVDDHFYGTIEDPNNINVNIDGDEFYDEDCFNYKGVLVHSRRYRHTKGCI